MTKRTISFHMEYHLGDCLTHVHWMKKSCQIQREADFRFYIKPEYHKECQLYAEPFGTRIAILPFDQKPESALPCWITPVIKEQANATPRPHRTMGATRNWELDYPELFVRLGDQLARSCGLENPIKIKHDMVFELPPWVSPLNGPGGEIKFLVINAPSQCNEFEYNAADWEWLLAECTRRGPTICTHPNKAGVFATWEECWTTMDLGNIAHRAENVIAIHTGPLWPCINTRSIETVKFWLICTRGHYFAYNERFHWARNFEAVKLLLARKGIL